MGKLGMYGFARLYCVFKYVNNQIPLNTLYDSKCYVHVFLVISVGI